MKYPIEHLSSLSSDFLQRMNDSCREEIAASIGSKNLWPFCDRCTTIAALILGDILARKKLVASVEFHLQATSRRQKARNHSWVSFAFALATS